MDEDSTKASYKDSDLIVNFHDAVIYGSDLRLLENGTAWLNDACINFFFTYLQQNAAKREDRFMDPSVIVFFMHQCTDEEDIADFTANMAFPKIGRIFIPVNDSMESSSSAWKSPQSGQHWSLLLIILTDGVEKIKLWHFDSVRNSGNPKVAQEIGNKLVKNVFKENIREMKQPRTPSQTNGYDCGIHVLFAAELFASIEHNRGNTSLEHYEMVLHEKICKTPNFALQLRNRIAGQIRQLGQY